MIYEYIALMFGILKFLIYKVFNFNKVQFKNIPKINYNFRIAMKKNSKLIFGKNLRTRNNVSFRVYNKGKIHIGDNCFFNDNCSLNCQQKIDIGNNVICGQNVMFFDHDHDYKGNINNFICEEIKIGDNVWIGANCIILKGVTIGNGVVIAAGTVVRNNISDNSIVYNNIKVKNREY